MTSEERYESQLASDEEFNRLLARIGDRLDMGYGNPPRTTAYTIEIEKVNRRAWVVSLVCPSFLNSGEVTRYVIAKPKSLCELDDTIDGLNRMLDAHWETIRMDLADVDGFWINPDTGSPMKVFDPKTGKAVR